MDTISVERMYDSYAETCRKAGELRQPYGSWVADCYDAIKDDTEYSTGDGVIDIFFYDITNKFREAYNSLPPVMVQ